MGCDIHLVVEQYHTEEQQWHRVFPPERCRDLWLVSQAALPPDQHTGGMNARFRSHAVVEWYPSRNYNLFAILADVRQPDQRIVRHGGESPAFNVIQYPRGLPTDLSQEVIDLAEHDASECEEGRGHEPPFGDDCPFYNDVSFCTDEDESVDWHSSSYLTVKELLEFDWDQHRRGIAESYREEIGTGSHWFKVLQCLSELAGDFPEYVRIVFGFDN